MSELKRTRWSDPSIKRLAVISSSPPASLFNVLRDLGSTAKLAASAHQTELIRAAHLAGPGASDRVQLQFRAESESKQGKLFALLDIPLNSVHLNSFCWYSSRLQRQISITIYHITNPEARSSDISVSQTFPARCLPFFRHIRWYQRGPRGVHATWI